MNYRNNKYLIQTVANVFTNVMDSEQRQLDVESQLAEIQNKVERLTEENAQLKKDSAETGQGTTILSRMYRAHFFLLDICVQYQTCIETYFIECFKMFFNFRWEI